VLRAAPIDPFITDRKVYAEGARVSETRLPRPESKFVDTGNASVALPGLRKQRRRMFRRLNYCAVPGYAPLCMDSNDPNTVECAFRQRLLRDLPTPDDTALRRFKIFVSEYLKSVPCVSQLGFEEWLCGTSYNEQRRAQLRDAYDSLRGGRPTRRQCSHIDTFVKSEYYTEWKNARMINSRADVFKAWSGPKFKAIENVVYQIPEFIKHVPVPERPMRILALKAAGRKYFQTDFTAFESHFTPELIRICEGALYKHCLSSDSDAEFLVSVISGTNRMRTRTGIRAEVKGRRMSGDMCTSLGNGFTNLMLAKFIVHEKGGHIEGFVEGDDGLFSTDVDLNKADYDRLGFKIDIKEVVDPCEASFCGMVFSESGEIIREPQRFLMGFGWTQSFINAGPRIMDELLRAKALSTVYETPQCPIVGAFARYALDHTRHVHPRFVDDGYHILPDVIDIPEFCPSMDTRLLFERRFGVTVRTQLAIESAVGCGNFSLVSTLLPPTEDQRVYCSNYVVVT